MKGEVMKAAQDRSFFVGKKIVIQCLDRTESEWSVVTCREFNDSGIIFDYEARGNYHAIFVPDRNINYVQFREGANSETAVSPEKTEKE